jgi:uncharacterized membrane protein
MTRQHKLLIVLSLLLNVLFAGFIAGHELRMLPPASPGNPSELSALPADRQEAVRKAVRSAFEQGKPARDDIHKSFDAMRRILSAEPFDEAAYDAQVKHLQSLRQTESTRMAAAVKSLAKGFSVQERAAMAAMLRHPPGRCPTPAAASAPVKP